MPKYYVCLELGGTHLRLGIVDEQMNVIQFNRQPTRGLSEAADKVAYLVALLRSMVDHVGRAHVNGISLALASLMDRERSMVYSSPMVSGFDNIPLRNSLATALGLPVVMEKDVNILLLYEMHKQKLPMEGIVAGVFMGTGLGNAMCIDGRIYTGFSGAACELGHIPIAGLSEPCGCGKLGCIERKASGHLLAELAMQLHCHVSEIFLRHGQDVRVMDVVHHFAIAIATEITIVDPVCMLLGGGVLAMPSFPMESMLQQVRDNVRTPYPRSTIRFAYASGDCEAGVIGAALHAKRVWGIEGETILQSPPAQGGKTLWEPPMPACMT